MRLKISFTFLIFFTLLLESAAQRAPHFTQYFFDQLSFNPAVAGSEPGFSASLIYRQQWVGFSGAPATGVINLHQPLNQINSGVGLSILTDQIGNFKTISAAPCYAYKIQSGLKSIHFGLSPVFTSFSVNDNWSAVDGKINDSAIPQTGKTAFGFDFNAGIYLRAGKYYGGFSVVNVIGNRIKSINQNITPCMFAQAGYLFKLPFSESIDWNVGFLYSSSFSNPATSQIEICASGQIKEAFSIGVNYRNGDSFAPTLGYQKYISSGKIKVGYAYDYSTSILKKANTGSHEIAISYLYIPTKTVENERYKNVRFL